MSLGLTAAAWIGIGTAVATTAVAVENGNKADYNARVQQGAIDEANQVAQTQQVQARDDQKPWREAGENALTQLQKQLSDGQWGKFDGNSLMTDPGYQFRLNEGNKALDRRQVAGGRFFGASGLKEISKFNQDFASNEYSTAFNRFQVDRQNRINPLLSMAGLGQGSAAQTAQQGITYGNTVGNNLMMRGDAAAAGNVAQSNAMTGGLNSLYGIYRGYQNNQNSVQNKPLMYDPGMYRPIQDGGAAEGWSYE
jgi:hypothetical protein